MVKVNANELLDLISRQWATKNEVKKIANVGENKALEIMRNIRNSLENDGYRLPRNLIPMDKLVDYLKINVSYLKKVSK